MKLVWVKAIPWNKSLVIAAIESGADAVVVEDERFKDKVRELGIIDVMVKDDINWVHIASKEDELKALELSKRGYVVVDADDWKIIPLENLLAQSDNILCVARSKEEASTAVGILEKGVAGLVIDVNDPALVRQIVLSVKREASYVELVEAEVISVEAVGMGYRVCVDTTEIMNVGEGMLVGDRSSFFFLVHSESVENPYVAPRPFRVNAGGVHAYIIMADGRTKYLCELEVGDKVAVVDYNGKLREAIVGRSKIEVRPLLVVKARFGDTVGSVILQNAETIRLTRPDGMPVSVVNLKSGDKIMSYISEGGRHFGIKINETIKEK